MNGDCCFGLDAGGYGAEPVGADVLERLLGCAAVDGVYHYLARADAAIGPDERVDFGIGGVVDGYAVVGAAREHGLDYARAGKLAEGGYHAVDGEEEIDFRNNDHMGPWSIDSSFKNNPSLKRVFFEESMECEHFPLTLYGDAFHGCPALEEIHVDRGRIVIDAPPFAGGEISRHATLFTMKGGHGAYSSHPAWSFIKRIVEVPYNMTGITAPDYCITETGTDYLTVEWKPVAGADGYYYTIMENRGSFIMGPTEIDFSDRTLPDAWIANNPAWTDDPEKCSGTAPSFLLEKSGDYIDITACQDYSGDNAYN